MNPESRAILAAAIFLASLFLLVYYAAALPILLHK